MLPPFVSIESARKDDPPVTPCATLDGERKLWFDFLTKLNDRNLEEKGKSGATDWVLLGVAVAIIYKCAPLIPWFSAVPGHLRSAAAIFFLELDAAGLLFAAFLGLAIYPVVSRRRLLPKRTKRIRQVRNYALVSVWAPLAVLQFFVGIRFVGSNFVKWVLIGFGFFWIVNLVFGFVKILRKRRDARTKKVQIPEFYGFEYGGSWGPLLLTAFFLPLGVLPAYAFFFYLWSLNQSGVKWVAPLGAATQLLAVCLIISILFGRQLFAAQKSAYLELEQAIVVENLLPSEIRTRFLTELLGAAVGDWLKGIASSINEANEKMKRTTSAYEARLAEIESIDAEYALERRGRAEQLVREIVTTASDHREAIAQFGSQLSEYVNKFVLSPEEGTMLQSVIDQLKVSAEGAKNHASTVNGLLEKLNSLIPKDS